jgi:HSP20 family molecular chaperone IbpA
MANISMDKVENGDLTAKPVYKDLQRRLEKIRQRAYELFETRGREPGGDVGDWLTAEREVLGRPPLRTQKNDREFQLQVPFDDYDVNQVEILVTPSEIIVHAKTNAEQLMEEADWVSAEFASRDVYLRIELPEPIDVDKTEATFEEGTLCISATKAAVEQSAYSTP